MRYVVFLVCSLIGLSIAAVRADIGTVPCPPTLTLCSLGNYGLMGGPEWVCCKDSSHEVCTNYWKQKWICNWSDPGDPATYGYTTTVVSDYVNTNCNAIELGFCY
jgi:hypothetical protein